VRPCRGDGLLSTAEAAALVGVEPVTIRLWRHRGHLRPQGLDERNRPLHTPEAVREAELAVQANALRTSGIDPRRLRRATFRAPAAA
jgi:transposase-like protein